MLIARSGILAMCALVAASGTLTGQMCFRANQSPRCHSFWITEVGISIRLDPRQEISEGGSALTLEVGHMVNSSRRSAFGAALFVQSPEPILGFGLRPRYRRWLSPEMSVDIAPGIEYRSTNARFLPTGQLALNLGSGFALTGTVHVIPAVPEAERRTHLTWYAGARLGGGLGFAGVLGALALTALVAATWN